MFIKLFCKEVAIFFLLLYLLGPSVFLFECVGPFLFNFFHDIFCLQALNPKVFFLVHEGEPHCEAYSVA